MKKVTLFIIAATLTFACYANISWGVEPVERKTIATAQGATGVSASTAVTAGSTQRACSVTITNTATVDMMCSVAGGIFTDVTGATGITATTRIEIPDYCTEIQSDVTAWTSGTVTVACEWF